MEDHVAVDAWRGILFAYSKVFRALEVDLLEHHDLPAAWFDVMARVRQAPGQRLRFRQLGDVSLLTRSGMTRLVDRIEAAGYVRREPSPEDRRGVYVVITQAGIDKLDDVWPDHVASIQEHFGKYLDQDDAIALRAAAEKVLAGDEAYEAALAVGEEDS